MSRGYYVFAIGGLIAAVAIIVAVGAATDDVSGKTTVPVAVACFAVYFIGIFAFAFAGMRKGRRDAQTAHPELVGAETKDAGQVDSFSELMAIMATEKYDPEELKSASSGMFTVGRIYLVFGVVVTALGLAAALYFSSNDPPELSGGEKLALFAVLLAGALGMIRWALRRAVSSGTQALAPLGLSMQGVPDFQPNPTGSGNTVTGATVIGGTRHGRAVEIALSASEHQTGVKAKVPEFTLTQEDGRLEAGEGSPKAVADAVAGLEPSKRWRRLKTVEGGPEGVFAVRSVDPESGWLWDLWLCELLAERAGR